MAKGGVGKTFWREKDSEVANSCMGALIVNRTMQISYITGWTQLMCCGVKVIIRLLWRR